MILEYRGISLMSKMIRFFSFLRFWTQRTKLYSHASWTFAEIFDGHLTGDLSEWESWQKGGVSHSEKIGTNHTKGTRVDLYELREPLTRDDKELGVLFLTAQLGKKYDWRGIFGVLLRKDSHNTDKWFCCELVLAFLRVMGRMMLQYIEPYQTVPGILTTSPDVTYKGYIVLNDDHDFKVYQDSAVPDILSVIKKA